MTTSLMLGKRYSDWAMLSKYLNNGLFIRDKATQTIHLNALSTEV